MEKTQKAQSLDQRVSKKLDDYLIDYCERNTIWVSHLNNGDTIYQDDFRPGMDVVAWRRLRNYCNSNNLIITDFKIQFRTEQKILPSNKGGYFFCKGALGEWGSTQTRHHFVVGYLEDGLVYITKYEVPTLQKFSEDVRKIENCMDSLIVNWL